MTQNEMKNKARFYLHTRGNTKMLHGENRFSFFENLTFPFFGSPRPLILVGR